MNHNPSSIDKAFQEWCLEWQQLKADSYGDGFSQWHATSLYDENIKKLLQRVVKHSPFLSKLALQYPDIVFQLYHIGAEASFQQLMLDAYQSITKEHEQPALMRQLRHWKARAALCIAFADIYKNWELAEVTQALTAFADMCVEEGLKFLLKQAHLRGEISVKNIENPTENSGIIVFGMGKMGAFELNYSSDIDLIIFFEKGYLNYQGRHSEQKFLNKIAQDLVHLLHERTVDGYVFRTDLRLRPDPSSTPLAVSVDAAMVYYESVGQNWERAAMIKARPVAGDLIAGQALIKQLVPFIWRKNLDFATIQDILSIKRQINHKVGSAIRVAGHNVKLGSGGIREIEFFAQLHQLIWGGKRPELRGRNTIETLGLLEKLEHVDAHKIHILKHAYVFLRNLEHRLQMVNDQQTHSMPEDEDSIALIAGFMGFDDVEFFKQQLQSILTDVHDIFVTSFNSAGLSSDNGNLVFTGTNHDPDTLATLASMGFDNPEAISETIMGWHHGSRRCTRTKRSRQILTELVPSILNALSKTANPSEAFLKFDHFLVDLPAGIQIFSLFSSNPHLLELIANIMGSAPHLSSTLGKNPELLESVLVGDFYNHLPSKSELQEQLKIMLEPMEYFDAAMEQLRIFKHEKQFQAGVQMLKNISTPELVADYLSTLADCLAEKSLDLAAKEFQKTYGEIEGANFCIIALGKLGCRELTFGSDIDLVFVYDTPDFDRVSNGTQQHSASVYYNRFAQRLIHALTTVGVNGQLFEVDTRLRPSGKQGLLAVSKQAFTHYFSELAWTFEHMALVKARVIAGDTALTSHMQQLIADILQKKRDVMVLTNDIASMRERVEGEFGADDMWDIKYVAGGLMDIDFIAQLFVLVYAHEMPDLLKRSSAQIFAQLLSSHIFSRMHSDIQTMSNGNQFLIRLQHILRLSSDDSTTLANPPKGLAKLLAHHMGFQQFDELLAQLKAIEVSVRSSYIHIINMHKISP